MSVVIQKNTGDTNAFDVTATSGNVNGVTTATIGGTAYGRVTFSCDGTNWFGG